MNTRDVKDMPTFSFCAVCFWREYNVHADLFGPPGAYRKFAIIFEFDHFEVLLVRGWDVQ